MCYEPPVVIHPLFSMLFPSLFNRRLLCCLLFLHSMCAVDYLDVPGLVARQREAVQAAVAARPAAEAVYPGLDFSADVTGGDPDYYLKHLDKIPGLRAAGWKPESLVTRRRDTDKRAMSVALAAFTDTLFAHDDSWPFRQPVDLTVVPDYTSIVAEPMGACATAAL